jgi:hypothetical protein
MTPDEVRELLLPKHKKSKRARQPNVGPSEVGGCRRKTWHKLARTPETNPNTLILAASLGTAIHSWIERRLKDDPRFLLETRVERDGMVGHVDCYDTQRNEVIDWKTIKLSGVPYFPDKQKRIQVQLYGWLLSQHYEVETVCLVGIPRDGSDNQIVTHVEPYDESLAMEGLAWVEDVRMRGTPPKPEKKRAFCKNYCGYYDPSGVVGCPGL